MTTAMTQYAYITPSGTLVAISYDGVPPLSTVVTVDGATDEVFIAGPRQYTHLLDGTPADLETLIAGIVAILPRWVGDRSSLHASLVEVFWLLSIGAPNIAADAVRGVLSNLDAMVRNAPAIGWSPERSSVAWMAHLAIVCDIRSKS